MSDDIMTKGWCDRVRQDCTSQVKLRYDDMKELFMEKLVAIADQSVENTKRTEVALSAIKSDIKDLKRISWPLVAILISVTLTIGGSMLITWRQVDVNEEKLYSLKLQVDEMKNRVIRQETQIEEALDTIKQHTLYNPNNYRQK